MSINQKLLFFGKNLFLKILIKKPKYISVPSSYERKEIKILLTLEKSLGF